MRPFLRGVVAAWSMRVSAVLNFPITLVGMGSPAHAGLIRAASKVQRAVVQGSVVVVVVVVGGAVVVVVVVVRRVVDVVDEVLVDEGKVLVSVTVVRQAPNVVLVVLVVVPDGAALNS